MPGGGGDGFGDDFMRVAKVTAPASVPTETFSRSGYSASRASDYVLCISTGYYYCFYDFKARLMITQDSHGLAATPFAQLDRDALMEARDELVRLKGNPPPLPGDKPADQKPANELKL